MPGGRHSRYEVTSQACTAETQSTPSFSMVSVEVSPPLLEVIAVQTSIAPVLSKNAFLCVLCVSAVSSYQVRIYCIENNSMVY
jgi:hypothetical protein